MDTSTARMLCNIQHDIICDILTFAVLPAYVMEQTASTFDAVCASVQTCQASQVSVT